MSPLAIRTTLLALVLVSASCAHSPYAGEEARDIKALSAGEIASLREGAGMGLAKAAELNRYPGPLHALELAEALRLEPGQRANLESLLESHKAEARALGGVVLARERELDQLFATRAATPEAIDALVRAIAEAQARLRASHLKAHLVTAAILTPAQADRYQELRGYGSHAH